MYIYICMYMCIYICIYTYMCVYCMYNIPYFYMIRYHRCIPFALDQTIGTSAGSPCLGAHLFPRLELTGQTEVNDLRDPSSRNVKNPKTGSYPKDGILIFVMTVSEDIFWLGIKPKPSEVDLKWSLPRSHG